MAGKTTELFRLLKRKERAGHKVQLYKSILDVRYTRESLAVSHDGIKMDCICIQDARIIKLNDDTTVVGIEEGQFIDNLVEVVELLAARGIQVIVAALNADFNRNAFPCIANLIPKCEEVILLQAVCQVCQKDASFTRKIQPDNVLIDVGDGSKYMAVCRACHSKQLSM